MRKVVPLASAEIDSEWVEKRDLVSDHSEICKFCGSDDPKYKDLKAILRRYLDEINNEAAVAVESRLKHRAEAIVAVLQFQPYE